MLTLKHCQTDETTGHVVATYDIKFAAPKGGPSITVPLKLEIRPDGASATVDVGAAAAESEEAAFEVLAEKLELAAKGLRARGEAKLGVPVYG